MATHDQFWLNRWSDRWVTLLLRARGIRSVYLPTDVGRAHRLEGAGGGEHLPVVLLHGISAAAAHYGALLARLVRQVEAVYAVDMPGHGFSDLPHDGLHQQSLTTGMDASLDAIPHARVVLVGNSLGGLAAIRYAARRPDRVAGLVLLSPGGAPMAHEPLQRLLDQFRLDDHAQAVAFVELLFARTPKLRSLFAHVIRKNVGRPSIRALVDQTEPSHMLGSEELAALTMPVDLYWGRLERVLPLESLSFFREHLPGHARVMEPEGIGHVPFVDDPAAVTRWILEMCTRAR